MVYDLVSGLHDDKFCVEVACGIGGGIEKMEQLKKRGIAVHRISRLVRGISPFDDFAAFWVLYSLIKKNNYDIVHCHTTKAGLIGRIAAKMAGTRRIYHTAHGWSFYNRDEYGWAESIMIFLERLAAKCSTKIICVSSKNKEDAFQRKIFPESKLYFIYDGINWDAPQDRYWARNELGANPSEIMFGMTARLTYPKDPLLLLKAIRELSFKYENIKLAIIGGGQLLKDCRDFSKANRMENRVVFFGEKSPEKTRKLLCGMDIFVLVSKFEGVPISIIEAMYAGLPVIASNVGGVSEAVIDNETGFLTESGSLKELAKKMELLLVNPDLRKRMGRKGNEDAYTKFTLEAMVQSYEKLYLGEL